MAVASATTAMNVAEPETMRFVMASKRARLALNVASPSSFAAFVCSSSLTRGSLPGSGGHRSDQRHEDDIVVRIVVELARLTLHSFPREAELLVERDRARIRREHIELDALEARVPRALDGRGRELGAEPPAAEVREKSHAEATGVPEADAEIAHDVAPTDHGLVVVHGDDVHAAAGEQRPNELARALEWRRLEEREMTPLARDDVEALVCAFDVLFLRVDDANGVRLLHDAEAIRRSDL